MMGRQLQWHVHPDDLDDIWLAIRRADGVLITKKSATPRVRAEDRSALRPGAFLLAVPASRKDSLQRRSRSGRGPWLLSALQDPVVEVSISHLRDGTLGRGRLYFVSKTTDGTQYFDQPAEAVALAEKLFRWGRRWAVRTDGRWLGPAAAREVAAGALSLRP
jgi:hypothetical protein